MATERTHPRPIDPAGASGVAGCARGVMLTRAKRPSLAMTAGDPYEDSLERAIPDFGHGSPVVLVDGWDPTSEATLVVSAELVTPATMAFVVRHTGGFVRVALPQARCDELGLPRFANDRMLVDRTLPAVSVDAADGVSTGISAADRCRTAHVLASTSSTSADLARPGHVVPMRVPMRLDRSNVDTEVAALTLCELSGVARAAVCSVLVHDDGPVVDPRGALAFAARWALPVVTFEQLNTRTERLNATRCIA